MIQIKSDEEINQIEKVGRISKQIMEFALKSAKPGITTLILNNLIEQKFTELNVTPWFKEIDDYPYGTCISINDVWIHGIPNETTLKIGDIVSVDIGVKSNGYYVDHCWTIPVLAENDDVFNKFNHSDPEIAKFLEIGVKSLNNAISQAENGNRIGDVSSAMQRVIEENGYSVIREYTGHGVGLGPHEDPQIACYGSKGAGLLIKKGMVFAIEIMYSMGSSEITTKNDGWSVASKDKSLTGMFEHTVAVTESGPIILTI